MLETVMLDTITIPAATNRKNAAANQPANFKQSDDNQMSSITDSPTPAKDDNKKDNKLPRPVAALLKDVTSGIQNVQDAFGIINTSATVKSWKSIDTHHNAVTFVADNQFFAADTFTASKLDADDLNVANTVTDHRRHIQHYQTCHH